MKRYRKELLPTLKVYKTVEGLRKKLDDVDASIQQVQHQAVVRA